MFDGHPFLPSRRSLRRQMPKRASAGTSPRCEVRRGLAIAPQAIARLNETLGADLRRAACGETAGRTRLRPWSAIAPCHRRARSG